MGQMWRIAGMSIGMMGDWKGQELIYRFNLVNHNNHGVDASKYSK